MIEYTVQVYDDGDQYWYLDGKWHRENGPAIKCANGYKAWFMNGKRHREDGPAIEYPGGTKTWYLNGEKLTQGEFYSRISKNNCDGKIIEVDGKKYKLTEI